ncbi:MAG TPA: trypsin-like serine protease [Allosphingosinicella sp.]
MLILVTSIAAPAIVRRHDVSDFKYRELGESYRQTIVEGIVPADGSPMVGNGNGTMVAAEWILTAAHVAATLTVPSGSAEAKPAKVSINGIWYLVQSVHLHPRWKGNDSPEDIALIKLKEPVPGAKPACLYPGRDEVGQTVVLVGTGGTGDGVTGTRKADGKLRGATIRVGSIGQSGMQIAWRFKGPTEQGVTPLEGISGRGDSGGPAFLRHKGKLCVAGVSSAQERNGLKNGQYGVDEFYSRVSFFRPWLQQVMAQGGSEKQP